MISSVLNKSIYMLHFPGNTKEIFKSQITEIVNNYKVELPDNLSIVSIITDDLKNKAPLDIQLKKSNIEYYNSDEVNKIKKWEKGKKPFYILDALQKVNTEYCIIADGADTCFTRPALDIIEVFETYEKDIIYNAVQKRHFQIKTRKEYKEEISRLGLFCSINGGLCIGKTETLKAFYIDLVNYINKVQINAEYSAIYALWTNEWFDRVGIDNECKLFQAFGININFFDEEHITYKGIKMPK